MAKKESKSFGGGGDGEEELQTLHLFSSSARHTYPAL